MIKSWWIRLLYLEKNSHGRHLMERRFHLGKLDHGDTQAPHVNLIEKVVGQSVSQSDILSCFSYLVVIGLVTKRLAGHYLGRHPVGSSNESISLLIVLF